jgi:hypothetical protein
MRNGQGRRRNRGPRPQQGTGTGTPPRPEQSARMDARVRGNAHQLLEKYRNMARDATLVGDRITAEYYFQYADHYYRVLNESRPKLDESRQRQRDDWRDRDERDEDGEDEVSLPAAGQVQAEGEARSPRRDRFDRGQPRDRGRSGEDGRTQATPVAGGDDPVEEPADDMAAGMIALSVLPPAISRPVRPARDDGEEASPAPRADAAPADAAEPSAEDGTPAPAPRRRGRPPKRRSESATPELEDA